MHKDIKIKDDRTPAVSGSTIHFTFPRNFRLNMSDHPLKIAIQWRDDTNYSVN